MIWLDIPSAVIVALIIFAAAVLRGFTGFGFGLAAVPLLGFVIDPAAAVILALGLQLLGGMSDTVRGWRISHWPSLRWLMAGAVIGSPLGALALASLSQAAARVCIAIVCLSAVVFIAAGRGFRTFPKRAATSLVGLAAGIFNGLAAMPGPPVVAYYMAIPIASAAIRASLNIFFTATAAVALTSSFFAGLWTWSQVWIVLAALLPMLLGTGVGEFFFKRNGMHHRRVSLLVLAAISAISAIGGITDLLSAR